MRTGSGAELDDGFVGAIEETVGSVTTEGGALDAIGSTTTSAEPGAVAAPPHATSAHATAHPHATAHRRETLTHRS
jgi:hypothetical protein